MQQSRPWPNELIGLVPPEREKQESGLIHVTRAFIDDSDARPSGPYIIRVQTAESVRHDRSGGPRPENHDV
jgi:hypothetical protein